MLSTFNPVKLKSLLKDFYTLTQIRITVFNDNFEELVAYPDNIAPFCRLIRSDPNGLKQCKRCDRDACRIATTRHSTYIYQCHAGLTEAISPIYLGNILIGYLFFGHVFSYPSHEEGWKTIKELCKPYQCDKELLKTFCFEQPVIPNEYITAASHILYAVASYLCLERMAILKQQELPVQIDNYIMQHLTSDITVKGICDYFHIGKTYLYKISKHNYGIGIAEYIRNLRIDKAKTLLTANSEMSIGEVSSACGFNDYNYFITVFKRITGMSPKQFSKAESDKFSLKSNTDSTQIAL